MDSSDEYAALGSLREVEEPAVLEDPDVRPREADAAFICLVDLRIPVVVDAIVAPSGTTYGIAPVLPWGPSGRV